MKRLWLILAALVAFAAAAAVVDQTVLDQVEQARYPWCPFGRPGCYSTIGSLEVMKPEPTLPPFVRDWQAVSGGLANLTRPPSSRVRPPLLQLQPHLEEKPTELARLSILQYLKMASMENSRTKRNTRKAPLARRRGKQREGARRVCRGCYSGLTIVAPPAQDGKNMSLMWSHSESDEDSSAGY